MRAKYSEQRGNEGFFVLKPCVNDDFGSHIAAEFWKFCEYHVPLYLVHENLGSNKGQVHSAYRSFLKINDNVAKTSTQKCILISVIKQNVFGNFSSALACNQ